mmetsp:Transcript_112267/g.322748  ORF Transcript_112267/g.322748 Transcript_112267/m.322748 type:complete len:227 (-) Transcript_112267:1748-2428(-)
MDLEAKAEVAVPALEDVRCSVARRRDHLALVLRDGVRPDAQEPLSLLLRLRVLPLSFGGAGKVGPVLAGQLARRAGRVGTLVRQHRTCSAIEAQAAIVCRPILRDLHAGSRAEAGLRPCVDVDVLEVVHARAPDRHLAVPALGPLQVVAHARKPHHGVGASAHHLAPGSSGKEQDHRHDERNGDTPLRGQVRHSRVVRDGLGEVFVVFLLCRELLLDLEGGEDFIE